MGQIIKVIRPSEANLYDNDGSYAGWEELGTDFIADYIDEDEDHFIGQTNKYAYEIPKEDCELVEGEYEYDVVETEAERKAAYYDALQDAMKDEPQLFRRHEDY